VAAWLISCGWLVLGRRIRTSAGELDLVVRDPAGALVAVEVKCRSGGRAGSATDGLGPRQVRRLRRALVEYRARLTDDLPSEMRVDLVSVEKSGRANQWCLRRVPQVDAW
jgi:putative endonuclease